MPAQRLLILAVVLAAASPVGAAERWGKLDDTPGFHGWRDELQRRVNAAGGPPRQAICAVVRTSDDPQAYTWAYIHWPQARRFYTWFPTEGQDVSSMNQKEELDLRRDVVRRQADLHGSTFRVTRAWMANVVRHCAAKGTTLRLSPGAGS